MKREFMVAASLVITHAYARALEDFCRQNPRLSDELKKRLHQRMEKHCEKILTLASRPRESMVKRKSLPL